MKEAELGQALKRLLDERGISEWELSRHANVKSELVTAALKGSGSVPLEALRRLAYALDAEVTLTRAPRRARPVIPVESVVDKAIRVLEQRQVDLSKAAASQVGSDTAPADSCESVDAFISGQRALLARLEEFARTSAFVRLRKTMQGLGAGDSLDWLGNWLIQPDIGLGGLPIDIVRESSGLDRVDDHLKKTIRKAGGHFVGGTEPNRWM